MAFLLSVVLILVILMLRDCRIRVDRAEGRLSRIEDRLCTADARDTLDLAERSFVRGSFRREIERAAETIAAERGLDAETLARMAMKEMTNA